MEIANAYYSAEFRACPFSASLVVLINRLIRACGEVDREQVKIEILEILK